MPKFLFQAKVASRRTPIFAAHFDSIESADAFTRHIRDRLKSHCVNTNTSFKLVRNTRSRCLSRKMRTFQNPSMMTEKSILRMPGIPKKWRLHARKHRSRRGR